MLTTGGWGRFSVLLRGWAGCAEFLLVALGHHGAACVSVLTPDSCMGELPWADIFLNNLFRCIIIIITVRVFWFFFFLRRASILSFLLYWHTESLWNCSSCLVSYSAASKFESSIKRSWNFRPLRWNIKLNRTTTESVHRVRSCRLGELKEFCLRMNFRIKAMSFFCVCCMFLGFCLLVGFLISWSVSGTEMCLLLPCNCSRWVSGWHLDMWVLWAPLVSPLHSWFISSLDRQTDCKVRGAMWICGI